MAYEFEWDTSDLGKTPAAYHLVVETAGALNVSSARGALTLTVGGAGSSHELYLPEGWQIEVTRAHGKNQGTIDLVLIRTGIGSKSLKVTFEAGTARTVNVAVARERAEMREFSDVTSVTLGADVVMVEEGAPDPGAGATKAGPKESKPRRTLKVVEQELAEERAARAAAEEHAAEAEARSTEAEARVGDAERRAQEAEKRAGEVDGRISDAEHRAQEAEAQLAEAKKRLEVLERAAAGQLDGLVESLHGVDGLGAELSAALARVEELTGAVGDERRRAAEAQERIAALERELEEAKQEAARIDKLEEARMLDVEAARADLEELKAQMGADAQTAELMAADPFLLGNSVRKTLDKVVKELAAAERRIGAIIRYRESYLGGVHQAIWSGDGSIPLENELQRGYDGDDSAAAEED